MTDAALMTTRPRPPPRCARVLSALLTLSTLSLAGSASADPTNDAPAQALFEEAKALVEAKSFAPACRKLELSMKLAPAAGTLLWLAACYEGEGRTATAWITFNEALSRARQDGRADREAAARDHMERLLPRLSKLAVRVAPATAQLEGLEVRRDDGVVASALFGVEIPVDPGAHKVMVTAKGKKVWVGDVTIADSGRAELDVPMLDDDPATAIVEPVRPPPPPPVELDHSGLGGRRTAALVVGGVSALGLATSAVFGLISMSKHNEADGQCHGPRNGLCDAAGVRFAAEAANAGNVSTGAFVVGTSALVTAGILWLTTPRAPAVQGGGTRVHVVPSVGFGSAAVALRGSF